MVRISRQTKNFNQFVDSFQVNLKLSVEMSCSVLQRIVEIRSQQVSRCCASPSVSSTSVKSDAAHALQGNMSIYIWLVARETTLLVRPRLSIWQRLILDKDKCHHLVARAANERLSSDKTQMVFTFDILLHRTS